MYKEYEKQLFIQKINTNLAHLMIYSKKFDAQENLARYPK